MTATVVDLQSRNPQPTARLRMSTASARGPRRALDRTQLAGTDGELVVDRQLVADLVADLVATVKAALEAPVGKTNP
jgi:hypothetical protein